MPEPFTAAAARLSGVEQKILTEAADRFEDIAKASASRVVGGGAVMNLHGRGGSRRGVQLTTKSNISGESLYVNGIPTGMWVWIEDGTGPHRIGNKRRFLKGSGYSHPVRGPIRHPGARGQHAWTRAVDEFRGEYRDIVVDQVKKALS